MNIPEPGTVVTPKKDISEQELRYLVVHMTQILSLNHQEEYKAIVEEYFEEKKENSVNFIESENNG